MAELVHLEIADGVGTITLDSPDNRNALSTQLIDELAAHLRTCESDAAVRIVLITHTGTTFCAGADLKAASEGGMRNGQRIVSILRQIAAMPKPVVARAGGAARAGGLAIVAAADIALTTTEQTFAFSESRLGLAPAILSLVTLPRMDPRMATRWCLTGETFDGAAAQESGLVSKAVAPDELDAEVASTIAALLQASPQGLRETKALLGTALVEHLDKHGEAMAQLSESLFNSDEGQEGIRAFREKRKPSWAQ